MPSHRTRPRSLVTRIRRLERELAALKAAPTAYVPYYPAPYPTMPWQVPVYPANPTPFEISSGNYTVAATPFTVMLDTSTTATINPILLNNTHD